MNSKPPKIPFGIVACTFSDYFLEIAVYILCRQGTWNGHQNFVDDMKYSISSTYVSVCHSGVIYRDLFFPTCFNINKMSLNCYETAIVHCRCVEWFRQHVVLDESLYKYNQESILLVQCKLYKRDWLFALAV